MNKTRNKITNPGPRNTALVIATVALLVTLFSASMIASRPTPEITRMNLDKLPMEINGYKAVEARYPESVYEALNADKHVYRNYYGEQGKQIDLYIGYYGTAKGGRSSHLPEGCLPGAGWGILERAWIPAHPEKTPQGPSLNYILSRKGHQYQCMIHWYQSAGDKILSSGIQMNIQRFIGRVFYNRNDGAFVQVSRIVTRPEIEQAKEDLARFSRDIIALLPKYWPVES